MAPDADSSRRRWALVVSAACVQVISGSVYAMGAWQSALRDGLDLPTELMTPIGAVTFIGAFIAMLGGRAFDAFGPQKACALGGLMNTAGYCLIGTALILADVLPMIVKVVLTMVGSAFAGYSSVSLLDNVVCMACSLSFPQDRAGIVGYLKAVLAAAAGLWALLWVHVFMQGPGLIAYVFFIASVAFCGTGVSLFGLCVLEEADKRKFDASDNMRLAAAISFVIAEAVFCVIVSFLYSGGTITSTSLLGYVGVGIALLPVVLIPLPSPKMAKSLSEPLVAAEEVGSAHHHTLKSVAMNVVALVPRGVSLGDALSGIDFWLLFLMQGAIFGGGVADNQNLALIFESVHSPASSGLGVALFALSSTVSRVSIGVLSDRYSHVISRFNWLIMVSATGVVGQLLVSPMVAGYILTGTFVLGLSFGSFFTLVVPVVNEMYGQRHFGVIMGTTLASQAIASLAISVELIPTIYKMASHGLGVCYGPECFVDSFLALAGLNVLGLLAAIWLQRRNQTSMPVDRMTSPD